MELLQLFLKKELIPINCRKCVKMIYQYEIFKSGKIWLKVTRVDMQLWGSLLIE